METEEREFLQNCLLTRLEKQTKGTKEPTRNYRAIGREAEGVTALGLAA
jgi:hypothetical protein